MPRDADGAPMQPPRGRPDTGPGHYLRDVVYGAIDGIVTTLAIVAGATGAVLGNHVIVILGIANLVADGVSMGASNYLGLKSELQQKGLSVREERPLRHGAATFGAFLAAGLVPLLVYLLPVAAAPRFPMAVVLAAVTLALVGAARAPFTGRGRWWSALEMLAVGAVAVAGAFAVGTLLGDLMLP